MTQRDANICLEYLGTGVAEKRSLAAGVEQTEADHPNERPFYLERARILREQADALEKGMLTILDAMKGAAEPALVVAGG